ncbi:MAG: copper-translocating P-type ATPase [Candidatus Ryanbacteria bacterium RIFCSPHIGHO2_01_FULL_45_22]|uniref:Copper-translocating P-type ATPase n=2 Tax=Candidatus Ryaniibacteriota TaxID=1817914 RepID=A0A1G2FZ34_9BACT|nr:MAG: copper-translocating P-type ATPase [Candidatus Ryanbacteria bacterium RIFCSPHIGHO2_01_FULL_45_22]OGZ45378.1 MAG: copper-translocating P-type ATPase [Candidatus Ryanbacteria bacterium RIFCSPHIGHO2_02_FULL_45_13b]
MEPVAHAGHDMSKMSHMDHEAAMKSPEMAKEMEKDMRQRFWISLALTIPIFLYSPAGEGLLQITLPTPIPVALLLFILTTPVVFWTGSIFLTGTYFSLKARKLNMAVLIAFGVLATYLSSTFIMLSGGTETFYEAGAMLVTFVLFGHWLEMKSRRGTSDALRALFDLVPPQARVIRGGKEMIILSAEVVLGDTVILKPGDKVPVDGEVVEGETAIDEALVTGESLPVSKKMGDKVIGGSINQNGSVKFRASAVGANTVLAQIIKMVETAQNSKAPGQRIADKAAGWLVIIAIGAGLVTFFGWYAIADASFLTALTFAVAAVVVACPDSLGLATPTAVAVGTGLGAKHGILFKDAMTLESASKINAIVLDKTGTLTEGKPNVTDIIAFGGFSEKDILRLASSLEVKSNHPIASAILAEAKRRGVSISNEVTQFGSLSGLGLEAVVSGKHVLTGTERLLKDRGIGVGEMKNAIAKLLADGKTVSIVAVDAVAVGLIGIFDSVRETSKKTVMELKKLGIETAMITGDNKKIAEAIGKELGIDRVFAEVLPEDKASFVKKLQQEGKFVAMVGDGVNDAPALAQSNVGIAIGAGTDVAIETGNIVLMRSDPYDIIAAIRLSKATVRKMKQNLIWAATYNTLAIPIAAGLLYPAFGLSIRPEWAALLMSGDSVAVAINAVLLKRVEPKLKV